MRNAEPLRPRGGAFPIAADQDANLEAGVAEGGNVGDAAESGADDGESEGETREATDRCRTCPGLAAEPPDGKRCKAADPERDRPLMENVGGNGDEPPISRPAA